MQCLRAPWLIGAVRATLQATDGDPPPLPERALQMVRVIFQPMAPDQAAQVVVSDKEHTIPATLTVEALARFRARLQGVSLHDFRYGVFMLDRAEITVVGREPLLVIHRMTPLNTGGTGSEFGAPTPVAGAPGVVRLVQEYHFRRASVPGSLLAHTPQPPEVPGLPPIAPIGHDDCVVSAEQEQELRVVPGWEREISLADLIEDMGESPLCDATQLVNQTPTPSGGEDPPKKRTASASADPPPTPEDSAKKRPALSSSNEPADVLSLPTPRSDTRPAHAPPADSDDLYGSTIDIMPGTPTPTGTSASLILQDPPAIPPVLDPLYRTAFGAYYVPWTRHDTATPTGAAWTMAVEYFTRR